VSALARATIVVGAVAVLWHGFLAVRLGSLLISHPRLLHGAASYRFAWLLALPVVSFILAGILVCAGVALRKRSIRARQTIMIVGPIVAALCLLRTARPLFTLLQLLPTLGAAMRYGSDGVLTVLWLGFANGLSLLIVGTLIVIVVGLMGADVRAAMLPAPMSQPDAVDPDS